jgi:hypothetical protein
MSIVNGAAAARDEASTHHAQRLKDGEECRAAALDYLALGWAVTCCCPPDHAGVGKKHGKECSSWGKTPTHPWKALQTAPPTADEVKEWFWRNPTGNVGTALGRGSRLVRLDLEGPEAEARLRELSSGDLPPTLEFTSGRADGTGRGLLFAIPEGLELRTAAEGLPLGGELRIQAEGAQTVLPPSRHKSGSRYCWRPGHGPADIDVSPAPAWLLEVLQARSKFRQKADRGGAYRDPREPVREGGRHMYLVRLAGLMRGRGGMSVEGIRAALLAENEESCDPPLPEDEVDRIAQDAGVWERGPRDTGAGHDPRSARSIIADYWRQHHLIPYRRGGALYSEAVGGVLRLADLLARPTSELLALLAASAEAASFPRDDNGRPDWKKVAGLLRTWAPWAHGDLLAALPEETASGEIAETAEEEFRRQLSAALLTLHVLGKQVKGTDGRGKPVDLTETERRTVIEWASCFAKTERWADVRSLCVWSCLGPEREVRVAIRAELFSQVHAPELSKITPRRLAELCNLYGLGSGCKVEGGDRRAVELDRDFVRELLRRGCPDPANRETGRTHGRPDAPPQQSSPREQPASVRPSSAFVGTTQGVNTDDA